MKTGCEWLLVESSKLQDCRQRNFVIRNVTVESAELSDHSAVMLCCLVQLCFKPSNEDTDDGSSSPLFTAVHQQRSVCLVSTSRWAAVVSLRSSITTSHLSQSASWSTATGLTSYVHISRRSAITRAAMQNLDNQIWILAFYPCSCPALSAGQLPREMYSRLMPSTSGAC